MTVKRSPNRRSTAKADGTVSHYRAGSGSPVVLIHGLGSRWQLYLPILDQLAERHEVIAVDLPGFGDTPAMSTVPPGPRGYAKWLAGWLAEQGISKPHVVGSSMGGGIALELGRLGVASRVTAFSPIGFYGRAGRIWTQRFLTTMRAAARPIEGSVNQLLEFKAGRALLLAPFFGHPTRTTSESARLDMAGLLHAESFPAARDAFDDFVFEPGDDLGMLPSIPTTIAWGTRDVILWHRPQSARARAVMPFATHIDLPRCGHLPFSDDPARCVEIVLGK